MRELNSVALSVLDSSFADDARICVYEGDATHSFAQVHHLAMAMATCIAGQLAVSNLHGMRVGFIAGADFATYLTLATLIGAGAVAVPVHPRLTPTEREPLLARAGVQRVLDPIELLAQARHTAATYTGYSGYSAIQDNEELLAILFTSGTSGVPKGAKLSRRAFIESARASAAVLELRADDRWFLCMPLAHVGGLSVVVRCLLRRVPIVLYAHPSFNALSIGASLSKYGATIASMVPTMLHMLLAADVQAPAALRVALIGGAAASPDLLRQAKQAAWPIYATYGLTEACSHVTMQRIELSDLGALAGAAAAIPGTEIKVIGEQVFVRSRTLFSGYLHETESALDKDGFFATGDLGAVDALGRLSVLARRTDLIVSGGENVYPREVELAIERIAGVRGAVVFGVPDPKWGHAVAMCVAADPTITLRDIADQLVSCLAPHKRPQLGVLVDAIALTPTGKTDRKALTTLTPKLVPLRNPKG